MQTETHTKPPSTKQSSTHGYYRDLKLEAQRRVGVPAGRGSYAERAYQQQLAQESAVRARKKEARLKEDRDHEEKHMALAAAAESRLHFGALGNAGILAHLGMRLTLGEVSYVRGTPGLRQRCGDDRNSKIGLQSELGVLHHYSTRARV